MYHYEDYLHFLERRKQKKETLNALIGGVGLAILVIIIWAIISLMAT